MLIDDVQPRQRGRFATRLSIDQQEQILAMRRAGEKQEVILLLTGAKRSAIRRLIKQHGLSVQHGGRADRRYV